jgi:PhnB protein
MSQPNISQTVVPYIFFEGRTEEALEFYKKAVGAQVLMMMRFKESPDQSMNPPGAGDKIMHSRFVVGGSAVLASDGRCQSSPKFEGFALTISTRSELEAERYFKALSDGGRVEMPLTKTFFSPRFGMLEDRFGVMWMVITEPAS